MRASPSGKAVAFQATIRQFESGRPLNRKTGCLSAASFLLIFNLYLNSSYVISPQI